MTRPHVFLAGADKLDDTVMPNATHTYVWEVRERSGPGPADSSSVVWMYHSHHLEVIDTVSGLYGAIIVSRKVCPLRQRQPPTHHCHTYPCRTLTARSGSIGVTVSACALHGFPLNACQVELVTPAECSLRFWRQIT